MKLALFDLDNTLIAGDSDYEWGCFLCEKKAVDVAEQKKKNDDFLADYHKGALDVSAFLDFQLAPLARHDRNTLNGWHEEFMASHILPICLPQAMGLVKAHQAAGDMCVMVTATNSFITQAIALHFGISHLIATIPAIDKESGAFTGKVAGTPSFREGKIRRMEDWLESTGRWWSDFSEAFFYSDSHNDLPLLEKVSHPVAVNPDPTLFRIAKERGWTVLDLRTERNT